jgi:hypothetical protein
MPSLADETAAYAKWGEVCNDAVLQCFEPQDFPIATPNPIVATDTSLHEDTETDDLWTYLHQYIRTGDSTYLTWANAWRDWWINLAIPGSAVWTEEQSFGYDHVNCVGLVLKYEYDGDTAALAKAEQIGSILKTFYDGWSIGQAISTDNGMRGFGRHLQCLTRLSERSANPIFVTGRDRMISLLLNASNWNTTIPAVGGMYFMNQFQTDARLGAGSYAAGGRIQSPFHIALLAEGMWHAWRVTGNTQIRDRLIQMAAYVNYYGIAPTWNYTGNWYGISPNCAIAHSYQSNNGCGDGSGFWDPYYSISQTNLLVMGFKLTGDPQYYNRAHYFWLRGTKARYRGGLPPSRIADNQINHYMDTRTDSATGHRFLDYNKGELQYTYLLFEPVVSSSSPSPPKNLTVK